MESRCRWRVGRCRSLRSLTAQSKIGLESLFGRMRRLIMPFAKQCGALPPTNAQSSIEQRHIVRATGSCPACSGAIPPVRSGSPGRQSLRGPLSQLPLGRRGLSLQLCEYGRASTDAKRRLRGYSSLGRRSSLSWFRSATEASMPPGIGCRSRL